MWHVSLRMTLVNMTFTPACAALRPQCVDNACLLYGGFVGLLVAKLVVTRLLLLVAIVVFFAYGFVACRLNM